ncbi:hypothetical protein NDU88_006730 [Pleurodeles waltl]|uniref:Uncharacterized protein n=1 Tax=Pleurodeles waltl TaxID=8319 RepID=A0AAV7PLW0_PLEWA|nr:hypothetical protein NDU88_006730 [Pleurodeles waltl]
MESGGVGAAALGGGPTECHQAQEKPCRPSCCEGLWRGLCEAVQPRGCSTLRRTCGLAWAWSRIHSGWSGRQMSEWEAPVKGDGMGPEWDIAGGRVGPPGPGQESTVVVAGRRAGR